MINFEIKEKTLIVLPHLDDEFTIAPLIKRLNKEEKNKLTFVFCAERLNSSKKRFIKRRAENLLSMNFLGINKKQLIYLNDYFKVDDLNLYKSKKDIIKFLKKIKIKFEYKKVFTLTCEGGHPDHDYLAVLIYKLSKKENFQIFFFAAYNYERFYFLPFKVLQFINSEINLNKIRLGKYCWWDSLKIAFIYNSEFLTFIKMMPNLIYHFFTSDCIYYTNQINYESVDWPKSLVKRIFKFDYKIIRNEYYENLSS